MFSGALVGAAVRRGQSAIADSRSTLSPAPRPQVAPDRVCIYPCSLFSSLSLSFSLLSSTFLFESLSYLVLSTDSKLIFKLKVSPPFIPFHFLQVINIRGRYELLLSELLWMTQYSCAHS